MLPELRESVPCLQWKWFIAHNTENICGCKFSNVELLSTREDLSSRGSPHFCFLSEVENFPCSLTYNGLFSLPLQRLKTPKVCLFFRARYFCLRWLFLLTPIAAVYRIHKSIFFAFFYFVKFKSQHINKIFTLKPLTVFREVHNGNVPQTKKREN